MGNIVLLDDLTINQIAAGEVIERPASVVKEMVENSIDAGANKITVEIKNGGISFIRITDNGKGIKEDDLELAFERHATSKIRSADDILKITSMGFRGEALASIAAIARVEMISRTIESSIGSKIVVEGGNVLDKTIAGCGIGTSITVTNLFYNTPVRYKFLKKDFTESGYIEDVITRLALVNKNISFKFINNGKTIIQTNGDGNTKNVIYSIFGKDIAESIIDVDYELEGMKVTGVVGKPEIARSNRSQQLFFVNGRYIKDKTLSAAADQAFKGLIPINKYGFLILNLNINSNLVDVNVHPAKLEVRFEEDNKVFKAIYHAIKSGLSKEELVENIVKEKEEEIEKNIEKENIEIKKDIPPVEPILRFDDNIKDIEDTRSKRGKHRENSFAKGLKNLFGKKDEREYIETSEDTERVEEKEVENENINGEKSTEEDSGDIIERINKFRDALEKLGVSEISSTSTVDINKIIEENKNDINIDPNELTEKQQEEIKKIDEETQEEVVEKIDDKVEETQEEYIKENTTGVENVDNSSENQEKTEQNVEENKDEKIDNIEEITKLETEIQEKNIELEEKKETDKHIEQETTAEIEQKETKAETEEIEDFGDMYKRIFGESILKYDEEKLKKELTESERKILEDIKKKALSNNDEENEEDKLIEEQIEKEEPVEFVKNDEEDNNLLDEKDIIINNENSEKMPEFRDIESDTYKFIGIVFDTYIVIQFQDEMYVIDQHAAHERIMYEKVKKNYYSSDDKDSQLMLLADVISLTHKEAELVKNNLEMFEKAGFTLEEFGENTIKLTGVPNICMEMDTKQLFMELIDEINNFSRTALQEREDRFIATIACKAAVKGKMKLDESEVRKLMDQLLELPNPFTCPHGRPTAIKYTKYDLERKFSRK